MLEDTSKVPVYLSGCHSGLQPSHHLEPPECRLLQPLLLQPLLIAAPLWSELCIQRERKTNIGRVGDGPLNS